MAAEASPYPHLFSPIDVGGHRLRNRIALPATLTNYGADHRVTPRWGRFLIERARGGCALLVSGAWQGRAVASAITAFKDKPEIFGLSLAPAAIVEGFAVFAFVFALVVSAGIPAGGS